MRPTKDEYYLNIARAVSERSTCMRRHYGAVIVKDGEDIIATGYNGAPRGEDNCDELGTCWREEHKIPHGQMYEKCRAVHAEQNAIISAARRGADVRGGVLYLAGCEDGKEFSATPCEICAKMIKNAGLKMWYESDELNIPQRVDVLGSEVFHNLTTICPNCDRKLVEHHKRCPYCGQLLIWD